MPQNYGVSHGWPFDRLARLEIDAFSTRLDWFHKPLTRESILPKGHLWGAFPSRLHRSCWFRYVQAGGKSSPKPRTKSPTPKRVGSTRHLDRVLRGAIVGNQEKPSTEVTDLCMSDGQNPAPDGSCLSQYWNSPSSIPTGAWCGFYLKLGWPM